MNSPFSLQPEGEDAFEAKDTSKNDKIILGKSIGVGVIIWAPEPRIELISIMRVYPKL
jgi:hypothetical protein